MLPDARARMLPAGRARPASEPLARRGCAMVGTPERPVRSWTPETVATPAARGVGKAAAR